jgi:hypothetical protein
MHLRALVVLVSVTLPCGIARADVTAPSAMGTAGWWVHPCQLFNRMVTTPKGLTESELAQAALCQGLFTGVMAVNYIDPPYLPFCEGDNDTTIDYARTFLAFMHANPGYADKKLGLVLLIALGRAHPKEQCTRSGGG